MELEDEESYAAAALFTLALHSSQHDRGNETELAWGEPPDLEVDPSVLEHLDAAGLEAYWGYDLVAHPDGLLEHVYRTLQLPHTKWRGLQALPTVAPSAAGDDFWTMLRSLTEVLDPELAAALPPLRPPARARRRRRQQQGEAGQGQGPVGQQEGWQPSSGGGAGGDGSGGITSAPTSPVHTRGELPGDQLFDGLLNDESEDEEWQADLERERQVQARMEKAAALRRSISPADQQQRLQRQRSSALAQAVRAARAGVTGDAPDTAADLAAGFEKQAWIDEASSSEEEGDTAGNGPGTPVLTQQGGEGTALAGAATPTPAAAPVHASRKGVAAMLALLQCCVGFAPHERPPPSNGQTQHQQWLYSSPTSPTQRLSHGPPPRARWYDARARVALKTMASWLRVTPALMANLECLLTSDKAPASKGYTPAEEDSWSRRMRYLKVGAAAMGGGALFAVTGGLAAPAIAAGLMSILPAIGAPAIVASSVAGLGTAGGVAFTTTAIGGAGAATFGSRMAHRVGTVAEFGFRELRQAEQPSASVASTPSSATNGSSSKLAGQEPPAQQQQQRREAASDGEGEAADRGHLQPFTGSSSSSQRGGTPASAAQVARARSRSSFASGSAGDLGAAASEQPTAEAAPSAWQRWFGSSKEKEAPPPPPLLPVPIRARPGADTKLSVVIGVAGWVADPSDFESTWRCLRAPDADVFALVWESKELQALNSALSGLVAQQATGHGLRLAVHSFFYAGAGLVAALSPTIILGTASGLVINNAWQVTSDRSVKAGKLLAELLAGGAHGDRPVSLVGHSMGARVIFSCLLELCRLGCRGVVEDVCLMGAPVETQPERWQMARRVVAGRLINCYSRRDWLLGVCYGGQVGWMRPAAGLVPIESVPGVENCDFTHVVNGHFGYLGDQLPELLDGVGMFCS